MFAGGVPSGYTSVTMHNLDQEQNHGVFDEIGKERKQCGEGPVSSLQI